VSQLRVDDVGMLVYPKSGKPELKICGILFSKRIDLRRNNHMFILWPNIITLICLALVGGMIGFIIYGCIKGFENTFPDD